MPQYQGCAVAEKPQVWKKISAIEVVVQVNTTKSPPTPMHTHTNIHTHTIGENLLPACCMQFSCSLCVCMSELQTFLITG